MILTVANTEYGIEFPAIEQNASSQCQQHHGF
jgi:hypothetical protein